MTPLQQECMASLEGFDFEHYDWQQANLAAGMVKVNSCVYVAPELLEEFTDRGERK